MTQTTTPLSREECLAMTPLWALPKDSLSTAKPYKGKTGEKESTTGDYEHESPRDLGEIGAKLAPALRAFLKSQGINIHLPMSVEEVVSALGENKCYVTSLVTGGGDSISPAKVEEMKESCGDKFFFVHAHKGKYLLILPYKCVAPHFSDCFLKGEWRSGEKTCDSWNLSFNSRKHVLFIGSIPFDVEDFVFKLNV